SQHKSLLVTQGRVEIEENTDDQVQLDVSLKGDKLIFGFKTLAKKLATREMAIAEFKAMAALSPPGDFSPHSVRITKAERTFNDFFGRPKVPGPKIRFNDAGCYHLLRLIKNQLG
ncbi:MAG: hypothetical protein HY053_09165, partial [Proteobacteria bacterium]|nr:hypothetical protein [Pseudomonadota bacterium]